MEFEDSGSQSFALPLMSTTILVKSRPFASSLDGQSPSYAASLRALGPVAPSAFTGKQVFPLAAQSPAVQLLEARRALAERVGKELEGGQREVRGFLDVAGVREVLTLRDKGVGEALIEQRMGLKRGTVAKVGGSEVVRVLPASGPLEVDI
ncbi:MAG: hypothetical protein M1829_003644 [Trizodia sp. TS-e1964]|nr:MAG: hypothetical protein M1829_003644 [Trizodia sp. TS-e1964]